MRGNCQKFSCWYEELDGWLKWNERGHLSNSLKVKMGDPHIYLISITINFVDLQKIQNRPPVALHCFHRQDQNGLPWSVHIWGTVYKTITGNTFLLRFRRPARQDRNISLFRSEITFLLRLRLASPNHSHFGGERVKIQNMFLKFAKPAHSG